MPKALLGLVAPGALALRRHARCPQSVRRRGRVPKIAMPRENRRRRGRIACTPSPGRLCGSTRRDGMRRCALGQQLPLTAAAPICSTVRRGRKYGAGVRIMRVSARARRLLRRSRGARVTQHSEWRFSVRGIVAARCNLRAPSAAYARALMAPKRPYTAERLRQAASASADGARGDHPTVADLSCEYLWPPLLSV